MRTWRAVQLMAVLVGLSTSAWFGSCGGSSTPDTWSVAGTVSGAVAQGVTVSLTGASRATTTTDTAGHYSFAGLTDGAYTVTPSLANFTFTPANRSVSLSGVDAGGQDFTASSAQSVACTGDVSITSVADLDAFAARGCTSLTGTLTISGTNLTSVSLPLLTSVYSLVVEGNTMLRAVALPSLTSVTTERYCNTKTMVCYGGLVVSDNPALDTLALNALTDAGTVEVSANPVLEGLDLLALTLGNVLIERNPALKSATLPVLTAGSVTVGGNATLAALSLPVLTTGAIDCYGGSLTTISLPSLTSGAVRVRASPSLASLSLPVLATGPANAYPATVSIEGATALPGLSLPALTTGSVYVASWGEWSNLPSLSLPVLTTGSVGIDCTTSLSTLSLPALSAGAISVHHTIGLTSVSLPAMTGAEELVFFSNASLASIGAPALRSALIVDIEGNSILSTVTMPALQTIGNGLWIVGNPNFPQCQAEAILAKLNASPARVDISGNNTTATCP